MTPSATRRAALRQMLSDRLREAQDDVRQRIRHERTDHAVEVGDSVERSDATIQDNLEFALLQMKAELIGRIEQAIVRLDAGDYGVCAGCAGEISGARLRALPFAVRCQACAARREETDGLSKMSATRRVGVPLFPDVVSS